MVPLAVRAPLLQFQESHRESKNCFFRTCSWTLPPAVSSWSKCSILNHCLQRAKGTYGSRKEQSPFHSMHPPWEYPEVDLHQVESHGARHQGDVCDGKDLQVYLCAYTVGEISLFSMCYYRKLRLEQG